LVKPISDILGTSGRVMLEALIAGETDPGRAGRPCRYADQGVADTAERSAARAREATKTTRVRENAVPPECAKARRG
jgi:hypothetical protein